MNIIEIIGAILGSSAISAIITAFFSRRKANAEAKQVEVSSQLDVARSAMEYADRIEKNFLNRINDLTQEIINLKAENVLLRNKIDQLVDENIKLRLEVGKLTSK